MPPIQISTDILPVARFKAHVSEVLRNVRANGRPVVITQGGEPAGVLLSPREYDLLTYQKRFVESVSQGLNDIAAGRVHSARAVKLRIKKLTESRKR
jgi:prevent-host-death family protein